MGDKNESLQTKKQYTELFLGVDSFKKPDDIIKKQLDKSFDATIERAELAHQSKINKIQRNKLIRNVAIGLAGLGIGIAACVPPAQALLAIGVVAVGVIAGANVLWGMYQKRKEEKAHKKEMAKMKQEKPSIDDHLDAHNLGNKDKLHALLESSKGSHLDGPQADHHSEKVNSHVPGFDQHVEAAKQPTQGAEVIPLEPEQPKATQKASSSK